ncbi:nitronate monooxygenase [Helicobacter sp. 11S02629-2]|uniref:NAD(P)H-dependent flavin oxidoreductase n=1 Tax=Helicobacter sp. 11S02629-2 TaxID=1476195 RepID=UPI000BDB5FC0|nr:nitronate monooxygenase [Helicobacter sp. 11S02629-2]PAF45788.1 hypothetical protein BKH40_02635 [Helicobacter sp. 11S02629-2]
MKSFCEILSIKHPIIQAPMAGGLVDGGFVAQACECGFLGSIPSGYLSLTQTYNFIKSVQAKTTKPFALNIFVDYTYYGESKIAKPKDIVELERGFIENPSEYFVVEKAPLVSELIEVAVTLKVPCISTTFGLLSPEHIDALKRYKIKILTTINSVYELEVALNHQQADVVVFQNALAGGHKGGFSPLPHSENLEILDSLKSLGSEVPCVLAGGVVTKEDIKEALTQGFDGVQIGSGFLCTKESKANPSYKEALLKGKETHFSESITGKTARGLKNALSSREASLNLGFPFMYYATSSLRKLAKDHGDSNYQSLWCGAGVDRITKEQSLQEYAESLV